MSYVYIRSEAALWTVGFYKPDGTWEPESDHGSQREAAERVVYLNGGQPDGTAGDPLAAFVKNLGAIERSYQSEEPPDGSIILVDEDVAYVRTDPPPGEPLRRLAWGQEVGDWYRLDGADSHARPKALGEILGLDDPPCDRKPHSFEVLYTAADVARLAAEFAEQSTSDGTG